MTSLTIACIWAASALVAFRSLFGFFVSDCGPVEDWGEFVMVAVLASMYAVIGGPLWIVYGVLRATVGQSVDPVRLTDRLARTPREEQIRRLEAENARLEKELGLR